MNVSALQKYLTGMIEYIDAAGGNKTLQAEMAHVVRCFDPFKQMSVKQFSEFMTKVQTYDPNAVVPPRSGGRTTTGPRIKPPSVDIEAIANKVRYLFDNAKNISYEELTQQLTVLDQFKLKKPLISIAKGLNAESKYDDMKVVELREFIKKAVRDMRGSYHRAGM